MKYRDDTFTGEVELDGNEFDNCKFSGASLIYRGGTPPSLNGCHFTNIRFEFQGAAANTVAFLQAMAAPNSGLQNVVRDTFPGLTVH
ncbi:MAG: hypothetical protein IIA72_18680 [Proteobacteria bacterium]|nr:hypothetical protein [Pseudomonadota bacterium]